MNLFERLANKVISEEVTYSINADGKKLLEKYHKLIRELEEDIEPVVTNFIKDDQSISKEGAIQIIAAINSQHVGTKEFELMSRLDTVTNGGNQSIDSSTFTFNPKDPLLIYLDKS